jgi:hypothetical protein
MISLKPLSCPTSYLLAGRYICTTEFTVYTFPFFTRRDNLVSLALRACAFEAKNSTDNSRYEIGIHDLSFPLFEDENVLIASDIFSEDPRTKSTSLE